MPNLYGASILAFAGSLGALTEPHRLEQVAEKPGFAVILSEAKNLSSI
jgi:hypothetical protein